MLVPMSRLRPRVKKLEMNEEQIYDIYWKIGFSRIYSTAGKRYLPMEVNHGNKEKSINQKENRGS